MADLRWGDIVVYRGQKYFVVDQKKRIIKVRKIIESTNQVGYNITSIPNDKSVRILA